MECADAAGAGPGAVIFMHSDLPDLVAIARKLEANSIASLHGEFNFHGGLLSLTPLGKFHSQSKVTKLHVSLHASR